MINKITYQILFASFLLVILFTGYFVYEKGSKILTNPWEQPIDYSVQVNDRLGKRLYLFTTKAGYWRFPVEISQIDKQFIQLLLAYEDKRFYQHFGVDIFALARAGWQWISNGRIISGASTLAMQTIRLLEPAPRTVVSKVYEMIQAIRMEHYLSKDEILSLYLTLASYGGNIQGINAASLFYFNKQAKQLNLSQSALLIALPQSPETRRPDRYPLEAKKARNKVLSRLFSSNKDNNNTYKTYINSKGYQIAIKQNMISKRQSVTQLAPHLAMKVKQNKFINQNNISKKSVITTTLDYSLQKKTEELLKLKKSQFLSGETVAAIIVDNKTCQIIAYAGSADYNKGWKLDLTRAIRSPGSALKPFIYGLGFDMNKLHPNTQVMDQPLRIKGYTPQNFNGQYMGKVSIKQALQNSLNIPAVLALNQVGPQYFVNRIKQTGVKLRLPDNQAAGLPIALGGVGINLYDLVSLYTALANQGEFKSLSYTINPILKSKNYNKKAINSSPKINQFLLSSSASWYLGDILKDSPVPEGFVNQIDSVNKIRFKTGTSYGYRDTWAVGYNDDFTIGVWSGRPDGAYMQKQTGINRAAPILFSLFDRTFYRQKNYKQKVVGIIPNNVLQLSNKQLPNHLKWLGMNAFNAYKTILAIHYPVDGSNISLHKHKNIVLKGQGGEKPYQWIINGDLFKNTEDKNTLQWKVPSTGQYNLTLIDAKGSQQQSSIWVEK